MAPPPLNRCVCDKIKDCFLLDTVVGPAMLSWSSLEDPNCHLPETSGKMLAAGSLHACCADDTNDTAGVPGSSYAWNPLSTPGYFSLFSCISSFEFDYCRLGMNLRVVTSCEGKSKNKHTSQSFRRSTRIPLRRFSHCTKKSLLIFYRSWLFKATMHADGFP